VDFREMEWYGLDLSGTGEEETVEGSCEDDTELALSIKC
jgi:hypothetical protein